MKLLNLFLFMFILLPLELNATKVALIPTAPELAPVADQALVAMSNDPGVEFLERTDIETILKERNLTAAGLTATNLIDLSKTIHADMFAVITAKPGKSGVAVSGLIVYDARNGFRLVNATLSEQDAVKDIVERLRRAQEILKHPEKQILLSIATVRDAGIPERFKYQQTFIAADLERRLGGIPNVIVLERDYLDSVNQERKITGQMFKLAPSARLLRLEFSPGSSPEIVNLILRVTDAADKELFRFALDNCLSNPQTTAMKTITAMAEYLKVSPSSITVSASDEAARFFAEHQFFSRLGDYAAARRKLDAAIALEPKKLEYRLAMLMLNKEESRDNSSIENAITKIAKNLELSESIEQDFPDFKGSYSDDYFSWSLINKEQYLTRQDRAELAKLADIYRPKFLELIRRQFYKFDLADGINSFEEWEMYNICCFYIGPFYLYWNETKWCETNYRTALKNLKLSREFFQKHPELEGRDRAAEWFINMIANYVMVENGCSDNRQLPNAEIKKALENMFRNSEDYITQGSDHPLASIRCLALELDLLRKTVLSNYNKEDFRKNMREYYGKLKGTPDYDTIISFVRYGNPDLGKIVLDIQREAIPVPDIQAVKTDNGVGRTNASPEISMIDLFNIVKKEATPEGKARKVLELEPLLRRYVKLLFIDPEVRDFFWDIRLLVEQLGYNNHNPVSLQLEKAMNRNVDIKLLFSIDSIKVSLPNNNYKISIKNAIYSNGNIYLLLGYGAVPYLMLQNCWSIGKIDIATGNFKIVSEWSPWIDTLLRKNTELELAAFAVVDNMAVVGADASIHLLSLNGGKAQDIKDLPGKDVMAVSILNDRIYAFVGHTNGIISNETTLFSCKFDGSDRQIHISTSRDDKKNDLDRRKPFIVYTMISDKAQNRLIFNCDSFSESGDIKGLWEFHPASGASKCLFDIPWKPADSMMTVVDNRIFFSFFREEHCIYNLNNDHGEVFFSSENASARNYLKLKVRPNQGIYYFGPFFARDNQIWFGGNGRINFLTLPDISKSPLIFMPLSPYFIFPYPDGKSVIAVAQENIYKITPKDGTE